MWITIVEPCGSCDLSTIAYKSGGDWNGGQRGADDSATVIEVIRYSGFPLRFRNRYAWERHHEGTSCLTPRLNRYTVATFVPAQADFPRFSPTFTAFRVRKLLIYMSRADDLRIRNAWVRGSNPLCGTGFYL